MKYLVTWEMEVDAPTPYDAARKARRIQQQKNNTATVFHVFVAEDDWVAIDLAATHDEEAAP